MLDVSLKAAPVTPEIPIKSREDKKKMQFYYLKSYIFKKYILKKNNRASITMYQTFSGILIPKFKHALTHFWSLWPSE